MVCIVSISKGSPICIVSISKGSPSVLYLLVKVVPSVLERFWYIDVILYIGCIFIHWITTQEILSKRRFLMQFENFRGKKPLHVHQPNIIWFQDLTKYYNVSVASNGGNTFVSDLRQVGGFLRFLRFLHQYNWPPQYNWNIVESGIKHHNIQTLYIIIYIYFRC
jgi:hypothetical protein